MRVPGNACACIYPDTPAEYLQDPDSRYSGFGAGGKCRKFQVAHVNNTYDVVSVGARARYRGVVVRLFI